MPTHLAGLGPLVVGDSTMPYKIVLVRTDPNYGRRRHKGLAAAHLLGGYLERYGARAAELETEVVELNSCWPQASELDARWILDREPDLVGLSCYCWNVAMHAAIARLLRRDRPEITIVAGGPEVSFDAERFLMANPAVDFVVRGEGEDTFTELVDHLVSGTGQLSTIRGLSWRDGRSLCSSPDRPLIQDLDRVPSPILDGRVDLYASDGEVMLETVRGCIYRCSFCLHTKGQAGLREFSWQRIEAEVRLLCQHPAIEVIWFADPTFDANEARALRILRLVEEANPRQGVAFELRAEMLTPALIEQLARLNVVDLGIGLQSTNPVALANVRRPSGLSSFCRNVESLAEALRPVGTRIDLDVIYGLPGDSFEDYRDTVDFALGLGGHVYYQPLRVLKGTELALRADDLGLDVMPTPPHNVLSCPTFPRADMVRAHQLNAGLDFLQCGSEVVRNAVQEFYRIAEHTDAGCSLATACSIIGRSLWGRGVRNLFRIANASPDDVPVSWRIRELVELLAGTDLTDVLPDGPRRELAARLAKIDRSMEGQGPCASGYYHAAL